MEEHRKRGEKKEKKSSLISSHFDGVSSQPSRPLVFQINIQLWTKGSSWAWLIGLAASTAFDLIKLNDLQTRLDNTALHMDSMSWHELADQILMEMHTVRLNFWRDFCDLFIPLSSLQYTSPGLGALCGLVSSCIGFQLEWEKNVKPFKLNKTVNTVSK